MISKKFTIYFYISYDKSNFYREVEKVKQIHEKERDELLKQIGQLSYENAWLKKNLANSKLLKDRINMIEKDNKRLSILKQAELLGINCTSLYYKPVPISDEEYRIKQIMDGKGRTLDNQRIECFFRSYKWGKLYLDNMKMDCN